jgi:lipoprotein-releasing system permease protein
MAETLPDTRPFAGFEWMIALRYLRARRKESFISVISLFSLLGIMLGVATLIVVMAVLNGFRAERSIAAM